MIDKKHDDGKFIRPLAFIGIAAIIIISFSFFILWRIDNPRAELIRIAVIDKIVPNLDWAITPATKVSQMAQNFQNYKRLYDQNQELRNELQKMRSWREAALQLEQENARLLDLNKVKLNPKLNYVSGKILVDSGNIFRQSAIINLGSLDGIVEGWAAMDGLGLVGRISGVGKKTSRILFLTDTSSNVPVLIKPSNQRAILSGDNSIQPNLLFIENNKQIQPGDRILTSGDGGVFPANLLIGQVSLNNLNQFKAQLSANFSGLEYLRIIRHSPNATINQPSRLIGPALTKAESDD
ncbi:rod shape-determining protein MreC [Amylibacter sp.]|nr:rod shape-determining protein MreC [Amylibacter sp.]MDB4096036.1 rod shape-determining protein MreC [Amylibacter sp.]MDB4145865.1 rod shape-determining protein MreC [Amylibacter sp.]MDB9784859.1 rod shape-determining protein MreC [Amylibacter sp.]MDB9919066.1 rod shape-determining protein MreC [Amylibacter sp.]